MKQTIEQLLQDEGGNYILPFFWQHGESEAVLRDYMRAIHESSIGAVCVEARPHPDFAGPGWWRDMDIILDEARTRGMKVWILDDAHFPTGYANGALAEADPALCKQYYAVQRADVCGPLPAATLDIAEAVRYKKPLFGAQDPFGATTPREFADDELVAVLATPLLEGDTVSAEVVDLTPLVQNGSLVWDIPGGMWRVFVVVKTHNGGGRTDYINMLDLASCRVLLDAVYEPHWEHYKQDFGTTIAGFFSDEPCVGNTLGYNFNESIGRCVMPLPWSDEMPGLMRQSLGEDWQRLLPLLWGPSCDEALTARVRYAYMDNATRLIAKSFSEQVGGWCSEHGVEYIGHVIEDNNQHTRLGCGMGHFFRSMQGQHMAGIDDIGGQVLMGADVTNRMRPFGPEWDGEFYHFALGKLGASLAHIDPKKQGRAMCEIFGAYGWEEGMRLMKYLADHFLVRGINHYVPHAFSPKEFPDPDCPPHFYAHGENPQYTRFGALVRYMNRVCHIFQNGAHVAPVALLYHGEAEWAGEHMLLQKPARRLLENQLDFDILPADVFAQQEAFAAGFDGRLRVNGETYQALVVPYAQFLPLAVLQFAAKAGAQGYPVLFVNALPDGASDSADAETVRPLLAALAQTGTVVPLGQLVAALEALRLRDVTPSEYFAHLRYYHYVKEGQHCYMLCNESPSEAFTGSVQLKATGPVVAYDAMDNRVYPVVSTALADGTEVGLTLRPNESRIFVFVDLPAEKTAPQIENATDEQELTGWQISLCGAKQYPAFGAAEEMERLEPVSKAHPEFSGYIRYETSFTPKAPGCKALLRLQNAYEAPEVWLNGEHIGMRLAPPYEFDLTPYLAAGENKLRIELATTLYRRLKAEGKLFSFFSPQVAVEEPTGLVGKASIVYGQPER